MPIVFYSLRKDGIVKRRIEMKKASIIDGVSTVFNPNIFRSSIFKNNTI
jgi:hypothetical protein